jgi:hypothetical protein
MHDRKHLAQFKSRARSRVSNGKTILAGTDGRSRDARRFRDLYRHYLGLTGGMHDEMCRSLASLALRRERMDAAAVRGEFVDALHLARVINTLNRTLTKLNLLFGGAVLRLQCVNRDRGGQVAGPVTSAMRRKRPDNRLRTACRDGPVPDSLPAAKNGEPFRLLAIRYILIASAAYRNSYRRSHHNRQERLA